MRYKIPDNIHLSKVPAGLVPVGKKGAAGQLFLVKDNNTKREFFINQTTKTFIEKFCIPKTFTEVNEEISAEIKTDPRALKKIIDPFFKYIKYRHFIVPENFTVKNFLTSPLFNPPSILDDFKIEAIIDVNGETDIYKAHDLKSKKPVVIKLLKQPNNIKLNDLEREFNFLKALNTTDVVPKTYVFNTAQKYAYFVQDFVQGIRLSQFKNRKKNTSLNIILDTASAMLNAFKKIHDENIVHGDIHPGNIMITSNKGVKILDFGLAINSEVNNDELINFGGVYFFMPPERIKTTTYKKFTRKPDFYSDVFQLGIVLYVFLYDKYPFNGITWEELSKEIKEKQIEFPAKSKYNFSVPLWLKNIISKCVAKKPTERFANAGEIYNAFVKNKMNNARKIRSTVKI